MLDYARESSWEIPKNAEAAFRTGQYRTATSLYKKAIRAQAQEEEFYRGWPGSISSWVRTTKQVR